MDFIQVPELFEIIEVKKSEDDTETVFDFEIENNYSEGRCNQCKPAENRITISKTANCKADHDNRKEGKELFPDRNLALAHVAGAWLVSLIWIHLNALIFKGNTLKE